MINLIICISKNGEKRPKKNHKIFVCVFFFSYSENIDNSLFIAMCIFEGSTTAEETLGRYAGGAPPIIYVLMFPCSHEIISFL